MICTLLAIALLIAVGLLLRCGHMRAKTPPPLPFSELR